MRLLRSDYAAFSSHLIFACSASSLSVVLVPLSKELGFGLQEGGFSQAGQLYFLHSLVMMISMFAAGLLVRLCKKWGCLSLGMTSVALGSLICACAWNYASLLLGVVVMSIGYGFQDALITSYVADQHPGPEGPRRISQTHCFWCVGIFLVGFLGGILLEKGLPWRGLLLGLALLALVPGGLFLKTNPPGSDASPSPLPPWRGMWEVLLIPRFWLFLAALCMVGGAEHCLTFWLPSYINLELEQTKFISSMGIAFFTSGMFLVRLLFGYLPPSKHLLCLVVSSLACLLFSLFLPFTRSVACLFSLLVIQGFSAGAIWPFLQYFCAHFLHRKDSTPVYVLLPLIGAMGCGLFPWLMGIASNLPSIGPRHSIFLVPLCYVGLLLLMLSVLRLSRQEARKQEQRNE
ncbi:MAG: MFS transporter [Oligosphaeraceae bacterium]